MKRTDVLIIGGGIVGCSAALFLAWRKAGVVLIEKDTIGSKASGVNFGGLRINGREPAEIALSVRAREFWGRIREHVGHDCEVEFSGHLEVAYNEQKMAVMERWAQMARGHRLVPELLSSTQLRAEYPWLSGSLIGGCRMPADGSANPRLATPFIGLAARRAGADILEHTSVAHAERDGEGFKVTTSTGDVFRARVLINAAGAWGGQIAQSFGDSVPWLTLAPQMVVSEPLPYRIRGIVDCEVGGRYLYIRQIPRGNVLFGRGPGRVDLEADRAFVIPQNGFNASNIALGLVPFLAPYHIIRTWSGVEGKLPDSLPVLDVSPKVPGLIHAFGFSGHGFQLGPGSGGVLADLALDGTTATDISGFRIGRFLAKEGGLT
ncbi:MAG: FAD-binding oxidoreductase [Proteobacteria bacterium]|nr:FAD-binding oxidoreductase [Pseudomonadota bacterium]